ncbi:MAG: response regulator [Bacteroidota bacterium]|nr:response regulator [Bacteroidota bacterium]
MAGTRILIVEDEMVVAMDLEQSLTNIGFEIIGISSTGEDAIFKAKSLNPDLVLMDIMLSGKLDGISAASEIISHQDIPVLFLTANSDKSILDRAKIAGSYGYILKPFSIRELAINVDIAVYKHKTDKELKENDKNLKKLNLLLEDEIEERKIAEYKINNLNEELNQKNKELEQIVYVASHDLRSPLLNINGYARELKAILSTLKSETGKHSIPEELQNKFNELLGNFADDSLDYILKSTRKIDKLVNALLKYSRLGRVEINIKKLNVSGIIDDILKTFDYVIQFNNVQVIKGDIPECLGDELQINQLFSNLIDNALKYLDTERKGIINIYGKSNSDFSEYFIEDNGIGIATEKHHEIFKLFYRLDPGKTEGEGIGLSIISKIINKHHGTIKIKSQVGKGTCFIIKIPNE